MDGLSVGRAVTYSAIKPDSEHTQVELEVAKALEGLTLSMFKPDPCERESGEGWPQAYLRRMYSLQK